MAEEKKSGNSTRIIVVGILIILLVVAIYVLIMPRERYAKIDEQTSVFLDYKTGRISLDDYNDYTDARGIFAIRVGLAIGLALAGLGITIHGIKLFSITKVIKKGDKDGNKKKN
jgi:hypothetical protein